VRDSTAVRSRTGRPIVLEEMLKCDGNVLSFEKPQSRRSAIQTVFFLRRLFCRATPKTRRPEHALEAAACVSSAPAPPAAGGMVATGGLAGGPRKPGRGGSDAHARGPGAQEGRACRAAPMPCRLL
jgi:hypothetical protein